MKKESITVEGSLHLKAVICALTYRSCWFEVTPLPDNLYEITTKAEGHFEAITAPILPRKEA